ncbi:LOW QUALITY PROTEIN: zinc finger CCCH domain-containing protein 17-like [Phalaenopsis equestris]|uniref:LOW QUALITY PROTEIN: zinc finger CCCH domain-containing protein 17-like n=1 Tax=Phalaenopsis equestris TaxID=78828 RepID=UPI0009E38994|nr:LOW QUALITY PROTEIN: zinc finger CCCH domain-containing protein 17-like [Phalaenopsis equestris]
MDIEPVKRYGNKRVNHRRGSSQAAPDRTSNKVCYHWRAGRCSRFRCPYRHSELPQPPDGAISNRSAFNENRGFHSQGLVWRNSKSYNASINQGPSSRWGKDHPGEVSGISKPLLKFHDKICNHFIAGTCSYGENCRFLHSWFVSDSISLLTPLTGHQKGVSGFALPAGSDKLYTGSKDESVRLWDCETGQCAGLINLGGEVGCMIDEGPWIFVGIPNSIKAWNTQSATDLSLSGPTGQVYAMAVGNELLFAGIQDGSILAWKFICVENRFEPAASLIGHQLAVVSLVVGAMRLYSGSMDHTIKVWDICTLQCIQTLTDHTSVVMSLLCWNQFLLSCSLDSTVKVWVATESGNLEVTYTHNEGQGVLALRGMHDAQNKPVLFSSCNDDTVRLYDLPSFSERGRIYSKQEVRAIQAGPGGLFFTGDETGEIGEIKVWKWLNEVQAVPPSA